MDKGVIFLSAGGTGGHLFPAEALAHELNGRGFEVHLATDARAERFTQKFPAKKIHIIRSATFASKNPLAIARTLWALFGGYLQARALVKQYRPKALVAFGGYPTLPPLYAAKRAGVPILLQEQNAVLGRANKLFAGAAVAIATGFPLLGNDSALAAKTIVSGNPVRPPVLVAAKQAYVAADKEGAFNLLIFGGSQGAQYFSQVLPKALCLMPDDLRARLQITQQARTEDEASLIKAYAELSIEAEISPFFDDMPRRIAASHLVICRAGASTVSELAVIGRPSILVPYPFALDHDQAANAAELAEKGGASIVPQSELDGAKLAVMLVDAMNNPQNHAKIAANAKKAGLPDAATKLADVVEHVAKGGEISQFKGQTT